MTTIKKSPPTVKSRRYSAEDSAPRKAAAAQAPHSAPLLTLTETALRLGGVHRTTIMRWVKDGKLRCVRLSRKAILFEPSEIDRFIREHRSIG